MKNEFTAQEIGDEIGVTGPAIIDVARRHKISIKQRAPRKAIRFCKTSARRIFSMYGARPKGCRHFIKRAQTNKIESITKIVKSSKKNAEVSIHVDSNVNIQNISIKLSKT